MNKSALKVEEKVGNAAILIVDKVGIIGELLAEEFSKDYLVFLASSRSGSTNKKIVRIPFNKKIPKIPDNQYKKIFLIDDGKSITRESAFSFIKKAKSAQSQFYFLGSMRNIDLEHADEIIDSYSDVKVLIFGDLFDNKILFDRDSSITKFIIGARKNKKIRIPASGLGLNYPITLDDTIRLIIKATFIDVPQKAVLLFSQHPITDISLANTFQKIDPEIDVDFEKIEKERQIYFPKNSQYALAKYDLKKKLSEIDLDDGENESTEENNTILEFKFIKPILFFILACLFLLLLPLITTYAYLFLGQKQLESAISYSEKGNFEKALDKSRNAETFYNFGLQTSGPLAYEAKMLGKDKEIENITKKVEIGKSLSKTSSDILEGIILLRNIFSGKSENSPEEIKNSIELIKSSNLVLQQLGASKQVPKNLEVKLHNVSPVIESISSISDVLPQVLGFDKEKKYLILFSNNLELRPGGGVVDAVGLVSIKNGQVTNFKIVNAEELNNKTLNQIEPPFEIKRFLGSKNFGIEDSEYNPDFVEDAITASSIYKEIDGEEIDGVVGINLEFIKKLISATGPLEIKKYNKIVSADNIYDLRLGLDKKESDYFPEIIKYISAKKNPIYFSIAEAIGNSILQKEILFAFKDQNIQSLFSANNLSGSIVDQRESQNNKINDFFGISETNIGKNMANYFVSRSITRDLLINEGELSSLVKITFKNNAQENKKSQDYKSYLRLILPKGSRIKNISIGGKKFDLIPAITDSGIYERTGFTPPDKLEVEETDQGDKSIFGFLITVPEESSKTVTAEYSLPYKISELGKNLKYSLIVYKQPGVKPYPFEQKINLPKDYIILPKDSLLTEINEDKELNFSLSQK